ncbi:hypothetical protein F511_41817 [Dorcoceras hygrometricum]|uniref:Uncharacterized protein n=1 Tax=Dorcoceras hygrometricum TaxID=472368 RepID=A0A2Z7CIK3_9LAMI|nr:hypothetical protein F511_41817 [Dorcoceras hygrometricum]
MSRSETLPSLQQTTADILPIEETPDTQISLPTVGVPSTDYTEAFSQLQATVDQISFEQVQTRFHLYELKAALSKRISNLETAFITASNYQDRVVLVQTNILHKEMQDQKDALSDELADFRKGLQDQKAAITNDLLEFRVKTQENYNLRAQIAEIIAYLNRDHDDKKGEIAVDNRQSGPRPEPRLLRQAALEALTRLARMDSPRRTGEQYKINAMQVIKYRVRSLLMEVRISNPTSPLIPLQEGSTRRI